MNMVEFVEKYYLMRGEKNRGVVIEYYIANCLTKRKI